MPTSIGTPHLDTQPYNSYGSQLRSDLLNHQTDSQSSCSSHASSPESRPVDLRSPILEEEEDETSSEAANEPITPTDSHQTHPQEFQDKMNGILSANKPHSLLKSLPSPSPLVLDPSRRPPKAMKEENPVIEQPTPIKRPTASVVQEKDSSVKRTVSGFFRRAKSQSANFDARPTMQVDGSNLSHNNSSETALRKEYSRTSVRRMSATSSSLTTRSNTPPSPDLVLDNDKTETPAQEPKEGDFFSNGKKRSSTAHAIRNRFSKGKISFAPPAKDGKHDRRDRATSMDLNNSPMNPKQPYNPQAPERQIWGMAADSGTGLKARRLSLSLPDDFMVDVVELYSEYTDQSKLVGRRGKSVGKGATANVRLMMKKGGPASEFYAVKEFRGKSTTETAEDYEKKVKSEFSIAKSAHHPNIVETFRLCNHNGRWNHVMEFCDQGDLFSLVSQNYLSRPERKTDRLCLFKQLTQGLYYLHSHGIAHRDIKLENLLITKESKLKITDFGVSEVFAGIHPGLRSAGGQCGKEMGEVRLCAPGMCGSPPYVAPEVIAKDGEYDPRPLDVWGAAIVMLCMTASGVLWPEARAGSSPLYDDLIRGWTKWNAKHADGITLGITESDYPHVKFFDEHISPPALRRVLLTMLNPDPTKRASIEAVAKNRWLKNLECCQIDSYDDPKITIDVSKSRTNLKAMCKIVQHNHLPPSKHHGHKLVRTLGSTDM